MQMIATPPAEVQTPGPGLARPLAALVLFGISFGFVEAAVVVYIRALYEPIRQRVYPRTRPGGLFPVPLPGDLQGEEKNWLAVELAREAATLVMLAAAALAAARNFRQWLAGFLIAFGVWDICFYVFLKVMLDWPDSLLTWDLLFLLPLPWVGPVLAPVLVALTMIAAGVVVLRREAAGRPLLPRWGHWLAVLGGGLFLVTAFCWDWRGILSRGEPRSFNWPLFALGEAVGVAGFLHALGAGAAAPRNAPASARTSP